jgi:ABC-2 type transport system permease protein
MNAATVSLQPTASAPASITRTLRIYSAEARYEFLKTLRQPAFVIPTLTFPLLFYVMFGLVFGGRQSFASTTVSTYMLATYGAFGVIGASLFGFAVGVSTERGFGWLDVKRAGPMPPMAYLFAKAFMAMVFSLILVAALYGLGTAFGGVRLPLTSAFQLAGVLVAGSIPFCALGLALGCLAPANSAPAIVNAIFLPMSFCSGLWIPLPVLPKILQQAAPFMPPYHFAQLALKFTGAQTVGSTAQHVSALAAFTVAFLLLARRSFNRDDV